MARKKNDDSRKKNWIDEYQARRPIYERYCLKLQSLLEDLLSSSGITYQVVEARAKTISSFIEKLDREGKSYTNALEEITDFAGVRVILYYVSDIDKLSNLIDKEFLVDAARSIDKRTSLALDQFGYLSVHKIVTLSEQRSRLPEWTGMKELVAEIQLRTVLQHSWAAISHALQYKREAEVPDQLRRRLVRLSGLLELADEEFAALRESQTVVRKGIAKKVAQGNLDIAIDALSIYEFLERSEMIKEFGPAITDSGFNRIENAEGRGISQLIEVCQLIGISDIKGLEDALAIGRSRVRAFLGELFRLRTVSSETDNAISVSDAHVAAIILTALQPPAFIKEFKENLDAIWSPDYTEAVSTASKKIRA
jgi:putative GTP pyrophosphokinase